LLIETSRASGRGLIEGITKYVIERQNWQVHLDERHVLGIPNWLKSWHGDGIISRTCDLEIFQALKRKRVPKVELYGDNINSFFEVSHNEPRIAEWAADHLWDQGFRHFAVFGLGNMWWIKGRYAHFTTAVAKYKTKPFIFPIKGTVQAHPSVIADDRLIKRIIRWIQSLPKPVGIWGITDLHAFNVLTACHLAGVSVPGEVAVLGTDNDLLFCKSSVPQLSSININFHEVGYQAAMLLDKRMNGEDAPTPIVVDPSHVVVRQSTDIIAIPDPHVARAVGYIREQSASPTLTAAKIARWSGISRRNLYSKFRRLLDSTIEEQIAQCRIAHACRLLRDSDIKITAIPSLVGLSDSYFFTLFQKHQQVTPQEYRNAHRECFDE